ncbi:hypothetical protein JCM19233_1918 [Vibrio astriarenae]|nr:hypothetical protein JCM19233_1918 [Vibrio sp. C7]
MWKSWDSKLSQLYTQSLSNPEYAVCLRSAINKFLYDGKKSKKLSAAPPLPKSE